MHVNTYKNENQTLSLQLNRASVSTGNFSMKPVSKEWMENDAFKADSHNGKNEGLLIQTCSNIGCFV